MRPPRFASSPPQLALTTIAAAFPLAAMHFFGREKAAFPSMLHFAGVGLTAVVATVAAIALTVIGARRQDGRTVLLGTAFTVMAALLAVHGIATPGIFVGMNGVVAFSGAATLPVGGAILALSAVPALSRTRGVVALVALDVVLVAGVVLLGTLGMLFPDLVPAVPETNSAPALVTLAVGLAFFGLLEWRALRTYRLTRRHADLSVLVGIFWLAAALVASLTLSYLDLGWWLGHAFELVGIVLVGAPVALDVRRDAPSRPLSGDLRAAELVACEETFLGSQVRALTRLLADRDLYTEEHTRRVALRAVQVGERLGLSPERLRVLAAGGLLHDIGKLSIPESILKKPGSLTDEEFAVIQEHPGRGDRLLDDLGFEPAVRRLVLDHHERLDGSGYPRGLHVESVDLETRILAACDVYDALISKRVYRDAWTHERAIELLRDGAGTQFDERCVETLQQVIEDERTAPEHVPSAGRAAAVILAARPVPPPF